MGEQLCLRWREKRTSYQRPTTVIDPKEYEAATIHRDVARAFVATHHYQKTFPAERRSFGLYRRGALVGVAVFAQPTNGTVPVLSRFVLLDEVPGNGETFFLARCFAELGAWPIIDSFSDPVPRTTIDGETIMPGHVGTIYQAFNGRCVGRSSPRTLRLLPDGRALNDRSIQKIRAGERGWRAAALPLVEAGADPLPENGDPSFWLSYWLPKLTRPLRHPGNWKYTWGLTRDGKRAIAKLPRLPYPKARRA